MEENEARTIARYLCELRRHYLAGGADPLTHWERIATQTLAAARVSSSMTEWATSVAKRLGVMSLQQETVLEVARLPDSALEELEREWFYVVALARSLAEEERAARKEAK